MTLQVPAGVLGDEYFVLHRWNAERGGFLERNKLAGYLGDHTLFPCLEFQCFDLVFDAQPSTRLQTYQLLRHLQRLNVAESNS